MDERLSLGTRIAFGVGDLYGGGAFLLINTYYLFFLVNVVRLSPALAGTVILISKIWDAISDPLMGTISDRTRSRMGRRRPYFLAGVVLIVLSFALLWGAPRFDREVATFAWVLFAYVFFSTVITMVMVPYNALQSELTLDYNERTKLSTTRIVFSTLGSFAAALLPPMVYDSFPPAQLRTGYFVMAVAFGLFFGLPFLATFFFTKERPEFQREPQPLDLKKNFFSPFKTPGYTRVLLMYLFAFVSIDAVNAIVIFFMTYYLGRGNETNFVLGALLTAQMASLPIYSAISRRWSKKGGFMAAILFWAVVQVGSLLITPELPNAVIYVFGALIGFGTGGVVVMIYSIFPDVPDIDELVSFERREGILSGLYTFMRKASSAVVGFVITVMMQVSGFIAPLEVLVDGELVLENQVQSPQFVLVLRLIFIALPGLFLALGFWQASKYPLTPALHERLKEYLVRRRAGDRDEAEEAALMAELTR